MDSDAWNCSLLTVTSCPNSPLLAVVVPEIATNKLSNFNQSIHKHRESMVAACIVIM